MVKHRQAPSALLLQELINLLLRKGVPLQDGLRGLIPRHWEIFNDLILFPASAFEDDVWATVKPEIWECVAAVFKVSRVARHGRVLPNNFRSPQVEMLRGTNPWVRKRDNGVIYELDITKSMFSQGNITEKLRMSKLDCRGEVVVDLFAGIGYFTIPLIKAGAEKVYACEWSPDAVSALKRNVVLNHAEERCVVLFGDNRQLCPIGIADRVILGLIPSSESSWEKACFALRRDTGGVMHVHDNVAISPKPTDVTEASNFAKNSHLFSMEGSVHFKKEEFKKRASVILQTLGDISEKLFSERWCCRLLHFECVKSYAPNVFHCVFDVRLEPGRCPCAP